MIFRAQKQNNIKISITDFEAALKHTTHGPSWVADENGCIHPMDDLYFISVETPEETIYVENLIKEFSFADFLAFEKIESSIGEIFYGNVCARGTVDLIRIATAKAKVFAPVLIEECTCPIALKTIKDGEFMAKVKISNLMFEDSDYLAFIPRSQDLKEYLKSSGFIH